MPTLLLVIGAGVLVVPAALRLESDFLGLRDLAGKRLVIFIYLMLIGAAFLPIFPGYDPLTPGLTNRRAYELGLLFVATGMVALFSWGRGIPRLDFGRSEIQVLLGFTVLGLASAYWSANPMLSIGKASQLLLIVLGAVLLVPLMKGNRRLLIDIPYLVGLSAITLTIAYLLVNNFVWGVFLPYVEIGEGATRLQLGYAHPLMSGNFAALGAVGLIASNRSAIAKAVLVIPLLAVLWLTSARGPMVGLAAAVLSLAVFGLGPLARRQLFIVSTGISVAIVVIGLLGGNLESLGVSVSKQLRLESVMGLSGRIALWSFALEQVLERPILGVGYEAGRHVLLRYGPWAGVAHNSFIEVIIGTGILGILFVTLFSVELFRALRWTKDAFLLGLTVYLFAYGMTNPVIFVPGFGMALLMVAIVRAALLARMRKDYGRMAMAEAWR